VEALRCNILEEDLEVQDAARCCPLQAAVLLHSSLSREDLPAPS